MSIKPIILCGGSGTRLWPESRKNTPKQFIPILEKKTLMDLTIERLLTLDSNINPIIVASKDHEFYISQTLERYNVKAKIILEPEPKNTTAAIYFAAKASKNCDNLIIMPSDHLIPDTTDFKRIIDDIKSLDKFDKWITLGINPTKPSEAYGYIEIDISDSTLKPVKNFYEKPDKDTAKKMLETGNCYWNSGIFIGNAAMIINSIQKNAPEIAKACNESFDKKIYSRDKDKITFINSLFSKIPSISIDYSVMENEKDIYLYPVNFKWNDLGSWDAIAELENRNINTNKIIQIDSQNNFIRSKDRVIATIDINDLIIVDSDDAILISKKNSSEKVKSIVNVELDIFSKYILKL